MSPVAAQDAPQLGEAPLQDVIDAMTTEEKALLLVGMGFPMEIPGVPPTSAEDATTPEKVPGAAGRTHAIDRLGIPSLTLSDGPAGVRINPMRAFAKTDLLAPGESQTLTLLLTPRDLTSFDPERSAWVADAGTYTVGVGASSRDIRERATFDLAEVRVVEQAHSVMEPEVAIDEREAPGRP